MSNENKQQSRGMTPKEVYDLGMSRESWCAVESTDKQDWCRTNRKHYSQHLASSMLNQNSSGESSSASSGGRETVNSSVSAHRQRRHYVYHSEYELTT